MIEEPSFPLGDPPDDSNDIPAEIGDIISQLKLLYMLGGEETVRTALREAGLPDEQVSEMVFVLKESIGDEDSALVQ